MTSNRDEIRVRRLSFHKEICCEVVAIDPPGLRVECTPSAANNPDDGEELGELASELWPKLLLAPAVFLLVGVEGHHPVAQQ